MPTRRRLDRVPQWSADLLFSGPIMLYSLTTRLLFRKRVLDTSEKLSNASKSFRFRTRTERKSLKATRARSFGLGSGDARDSAADGASVLGLGRHGGHHRRRLNVVVVAFHHLPKPVYGRQHAAGPIRFFAI